MISLRRSGPSIRHCARIALVSDDAPRSWVHIARAGRFDGYHGGGFELSAAVFEQMRSNFAAQDNPIPFVYEHPVATGGPMPGAGWIHELDVRDDGLWAHVEWTPRAREMIRDGEYRYCSMVFSERATDRETGDDVGAVLYEVGLTNSPFIDGLEPITLRRQSMSESAAIRRLHRALGVVTRGRRGAEQARRTALGVAIARLGVTHDRAAEIVAPGMTLLDDAEVTRLSRVVALAVDVDAIQDALDELPPEAEPEEILAVVDEAIREELDEEIVEAGAKDEDAKAMDATSDAEAAVDAVALAMGATAPEVAQMLVARAGDVAALLAGDESAEPAETMLKRLAAMETSIAALKRERDAARLELRSTRYEAALSRAKAGGLTASEETVYAELYKADADAAIRTLSARAGTATPPQGRRYQRTDELAAHGRISEIVDPSERAKAERVALSQLSGRAAAVYQMTRTVNPHMSIDDALSVARKES